MPQTISLTEKPKPTKESMDSSVSSHVGPFSFPRKSFTKSLILGFLWWYSPILARIIRILNWTELDTVSSVSIMRASTLVPTFDGLMMKVSACFEKHASGSKVPIWASRTERVQELPLQLGSTAQGERGFHASAGGFMLTRNLLRSCRSHAPSDLGHCCGSCR
jgi:hypothetical protein